MYFQVSHNSESWALCSTFKDKTKTLKWALCGKNIQRPYKHLPDSYELWNFESFTLNIAFSLYAPHTRTSGTSTKTTAPITALHPSRSWRAVPFIFWDWILRPSRCVWRSASCTPTTVTILFPSRTARTINRWSKEYSNLISDGIVERRNLWTKNITFELFYGRNCFRFT